MKKLEVKFKNCFGIKEMNEKFDFEKSNIQLIYAKNGSMKTSFAKIFKKYQKGKQLEIKDNIFEDNEEKYLIRGDNDWLNIKGNKENSEDILGNENENIFVIGSLDESYESGSISNLLLNKDLRRNFDKILELKFDLLKNLKKTTGLVIPESKEIKDNETISKLEKRFLKDFGINSDDFLGSLKKIKLENPIEIDILYKDIFKNDSVVDLIESEDFQKSVEDFIQKSKEIYNEIKAKYPFLKKNGFTVFNFQTIAKSLKDNGYFSVDGNNLVLNGKEGYVDEKILEEILTSLDKEFSKIPAYIKLNKSLNKNQDAKKLAEKLENEKLNIITKLKDYKIFRKELWSTYLLEEETKEFFDLLKEEYIKLEEEIEKNNSDNLKKTKWKEAVGLFNERFSVPFSMEIKNLKNAVLGNIPIVEFNFYKDGDKKNTDKDNIVTKNKEQVLEILSQGEKRALYLLNIIFDIENLKKEAEYNSGKEILFVIDDIADSFDYANKYAIVEYLKEIQEFEIKIGDKKIKPFYSIILTHNFDFFRTLSARFNTKENEEERWRFIVKNTKENIILEPTTKELTHPFEEWIKIVENKNNNFKKYIVALIPFSREIFKFNRKKNIFEGILHGSDECLKKIREEYQKFYGFGGDYNFGDEELENKKISIFMEEVSCKIISDGSDKLVDKVVLALYIRISAEKFLNNISENIKKENNYQRKLLIYEKHKKYNKYKYIILKEVNIMTPENIHLNSFMYEPILDMDIIELKKLYEKVDKLKKK